MNKAGTYGVEMETACEAGAGGEWVLSAGGRKITGQAPVTRGWDDFTSVKPGRLELEQGAVTVKIKPVRKPKAALMNLRRISLKPE